MWFRLGGYALLVSPLLLLKYAGLFAVGESVILRQVALKMMVIVAPCRRLGIFPKFALALTSFDLMPYLGTFANFVELLRALAVFFRVGAESLPLPWVSRKLTAAH